MIISEILTIDGMPRTNTGTNARDEKWSSGRRGKHPNPGACIVSMQGLAQRRSLGVTCPTSAVGHLLGTQTCNQELSAGDRADRINRTPLLLRQAGPILRA